MRETAYPPTVILDTTNVCNARCPFCPLFHGEGQFDRKTRPASVMSLDLYETMIAEIAAWPERPASLTHSANGEILQDPKVLDRLEILRKHGLASVTTLLTNAQYLDERASRAIVEAGIGHIIVGFDGATKATYESHRVRCDYDRVLANIRRFVEVRSLLGGRTSVWIKFVRTPRNQQEVEGAFALFAAFMDPELDRFQDALAVDWSDSPSTESDIYFRPKVQHGVRRDSCSYFDNVLEISSDGMVAACCWDYNLKISSGGLGSALDSSLLEIWQGQKRRDLGRAHMPGGVGLPEKCQTCVIMHEQAPISADLVKIEGRFLEATSDTSLIYTFRPRQEAAPIAA